VMHGIGKRKESKHGWLAGSPALLLLCISPWKARQNQAKAKEAQKKTRCRNATTRNSDWHKSLPLPPVLLLLLLHSLPHIIICSHIAAAAASVVVPAAPPPPLGPPVHLH
jgi:hypothetical protein